MKDRTVKQAGPPFGDPACSGLAQRVGFEPTEVLTPHLISNQARCDRFDTAACVVFIMPHVPQKCKREVEESGPSLCGGTRSAGRGVSNHALTWTVIKSETRSYPGRFPHGGKAEISYSNRQKYCNVRSGKHGCTAHGRGAVILTIAIKKRPCPAGQGRFGTFRRADERNAYSSISVTAPEPTVRPPSRMAKRRPFSMAMGVISSTLISTLSPGIHISVPSGRVMTPVTSVVRK